MKKLSDSALYMEMLQNQKVKNAIKTVSIERDGVDKAELEDQINVINKKLNLSLKSNVLKLYASNIICPIYTNTVSIPKYLNTFGKMEGGKIMFFTDITKYANKTSNGIDIFPKTLFGLLQNATINYSLITKWDTITNNLTILKNASICYSKMVNKVLDKTFAININPTLTDAVNFIVAKFFLTSMCDKRNEETINNIAYLSCFNKTTLPTILQEEEIFDKSNYENIFSLMKGLSKLKGLENIKIRTFVEQFARMYGEGTLLGIDYFPAFLGIIASVNCGCNLHKDYIIESVISKFSNKVYLELSRIL